MKAESAQIRLSQVHDAEALSQCVSRVAGEGRWLGTISGFDAEDTRHFIEEVHQHGGTQFVALEHEQIVGWCDIFRLQPAGMDHVGRLGMGLLPDWRGRGVGTRLLEASLAKVDGGGIIRIELEVFPDNPVAISLYERNGFQREGYKRCAWCIDGQMRDVIIYARVST